MTSSKEIEEILHEAHAENIFDDVILEVNKLSIRDKISIKDKLIIYRQAIENVRRNKTI